MSALMRHVALVSKSKSISASELSSVAAAMNTQVVRDFGPVWNLKGTVAAFPTLKDVPVNYWPVIVLDKLNDPTAGGYHQTSKGEPFAVVLASDFPIAASHETLEMLVDPFGRHLIAGAPPPNSPSPIDTFSTVRYLVEVCDPCEGEQFAYTINGATVSDFITPDYYNSSITAGTRYSFTGAIKQPHQILEAGYISFENPANGRWWQIFVQNGQSVAQELPANDFRRMPIREATDEAARRFREKHGHRGRHERAAMAMAAAIGAGRAHDIEEEVEKL